MKLLSFGLVSLLTVGPLTAGDFAARYEQRIAHHQQEYSLDHEFRNTDMPSIEKMKQEYDEFSVFQRGAKFLIERQIPFARFFRTMASEPDYTTIGLFALGLHPDLGVEVKVASYGYALSKNRRSAFAIGLSEFHVPGVLRQVGKEAERRYFAHQQR